MYNKKMWKKIKNKFFSNNTEKIDYLVVGLGNPGEKYKKTAHNSGFRVVSFLKEITSMPNFTKDNTLNSFISKGKIEEKKIILLLPLTYMNLSGEAVKRAIKRFKIPPDGLILVHDDTDIEIGTIKFSKSRGSAGHKGVSSVMKAINTKDFFRVRVGVSKKNNEEKAKDFVLQNMPTKTDEIERKTAEKIKESILSNFSQETLKTKNNTV